MLAAHTLETQVGEIVRYTEYTCDLAECFNPARNFCPITPVCHLKPLLYRARRAFFDVLDAVSVHEIARNPKELSPIFAASRAASKVKGAEPRPDATLDLEAGFSVPPDAADGDAQP